MAEDMAIISLKNWDAALEVAKRRSGNGTPITSGELAQRIEDIPNQKPEVQGKETITTNGVKTFAPPDGSVFNSFEVTTDTPEPKPEQEKTVNITESGTYNIEVTPDAGKTMNKVIAKVDVKGGGGGFPNGTEWTQSNVTRGAFGTLAVDNGVWIASGANLGLYYSDDGISWNRSNITNGTFLYLLYGKNVWVTGGTMGIYSSKDNGRTWQKSNVPNFANPVYIGFKEGKWIACLLDKGIRYSNDGISWMNTNVTSGTYGRGIDRNRPSAYYADGRWVLCNSTNGGLYTSTDCERWQITQQKSGKFGIISYKFGKWIASSNEENGLYYSDDGINWNRSNITSGSSSCLVNLKGTWVANDGAFESYYSKNGKTWKISNTLVLEDIFLEANGMAIAASGGSSSNVYYSYDGVNWTSSDLVTQVYDVFCENGIWNVVTPFGGFYSVDGKKWSESVIIPNSALFVIRYSNGMWVAGSRKDGLYYSIGWAPTV